MTTVTKQSDEIPQILIIDDNRDIHEDFRSILCDTTDDGNRLASMAQAILDPDTKAKPAAQSNQYKLLSAYQGKEGLSLLQADREAGQRIPLAFVDMRMPPGWDGLETIERLWAVAPDLQVVICSAFSDYDWEEIIQRVGQRHNLLILKKPFEPAEVKQIAAAMVGKWKSEQAAIDHLSKMQNSVERLLQEVRQRESLEESLRFQSLHDHLTSLANRAALLARLEQCTKRHERIPGYRSCVLFLDLDKFKFVNDSLGHRCGDELLIEVASRLTHCLRELPLEHKPEGELLARLGGDEFVVLLEGVNDPQSPIYVAQQIQSRFAVPAHIEGNDVSIATSIGIAFNDGSYETPDDILRNADTALFSAKSAGRGCHEVFNKQMHENERHRLRLEADLRHAISRRELALHFQPIVDLQTGTTTSFESLLRWKHSELGMIGPNEFIPIAEDTGQIIPIGNWVIEEACQVLARWQSMFGDKCPSVSINVSARQFAVKDFAGHLQQAIRQAGIDPGLLDIEITESAVIQNSEAVSNALANIRSNGHRIYLDDFGTGYSSLSQLHDLPIDLVKIDRSFVQQIDSSGQAANTIQAIVTMSHNRGMQVVVEGLERIEQLVQAQALECDLGQGYFFSKAVPADQAESQIIRPWIWAKVA